MWLRSDASKGGVSAELPGGRGCGLPPPMSQDDILSMLSRPKQADFTPRERLARQLCIEDGQDPDYCVEGEIRDIGSGMCAYRCNRFAWQGYLAVADERIAADGA